MPYALVLENAVVKELQTLPAKQYKQVVTKLLSLARTPRPNDARALRGYSGLRVTQGEFRILYTVDDEAKVVTVFIVDRRNDDEAYRRLSR